MNIDTFWLDDDAMAQISRQSPSTPAGLKFMREMWPNRFAGLLSSDTYRGYAIVFSMLCRSMRNGISLHEIEQLVELVDESAKKSQTLPKETDRLGGAILATTNAWEDSHCGVSTHDFVAACESQLIYAAQKFVTARQQGL